MSEKFRKAGTADIPPLEVWVMHDDRINLDIHSERGVTRVALGIEKARALRDWLTLALPAETEGDANVAVD